MPTNGEHDHDLTVTESPATRLRRLADIQQRYIDNLRSTADLADSFGGHPPPGFFDDIAAEAGEVGDAWHDLRRGLKNL